MSAEHPRHYQAGDTVLLATALRATGRPVVVVLPGTDATVVLGALEQALAIPGVKVGLRGGK